MNRQNPSRKFPDCVRDGKSRSDGFIEEEDIFRHGCHIAPIGTEDLTDLAENSLLIRHLMSEDFFHVDSFPDARFELKECQVLAEAFPGSPNCSIKGSLTIKGTTNEVIVPAMVVPDNGEGIRAQACFDIDRTEWNIAYGSGKLFEKLGRHLVNDTVSLELYITAR